MIAKMAKKGMTPSQIGVILRDSHGIAQVRQQRRLHRAGGGGIAHRQAALLPASRRPATWPAAQHRTLAQSAACCCSRPHPPSPHLHPAPTACRSSP